MKLINGIQIDWKRLEPYIRNDDITDIKCSSHSVWVKDVKKGTKKLNFNIDTKDIESLARQISNHEKVQFNAVRPVLQADYDDLRFQFVDQSVSPSGINMTIRKTPFIRRIDPKKVEKNGYCSLLLMDLIQAAVKNKLGIVNCGETGSGKTELAKVECSFIPDYQGIITLEDTSELHLATLFPNKNIIELKVNSYFSIDDANKATMRMDPDWVLLSEARGKEIANLMETRSEGHGIITTLHMKNARSLSERIINMYDPMNRPNDQTIENMVFDYFDLCIHLRCDISENATLRYIDEVCVYERVKGGNKQSTIYEVKQGDFIYYELPKMFQEILDVTLAERWNQHAEKGSQ